MRACKFVGIVFISFWFSACASQQSIRDTVAGLQAGPNSPPTRTITNFSDGLTCMDKMLLEYKMPETTFLIENLTDNTGKVSGGTRDMLITALAAMSKRSNTVRVIAYGYDSSNAIAFIERTGAQQLYSNPPRYDIRGSISQYDSRVASNRASAAVNSRKWGLGGDKRVSGDVLGIDLSIIRTADLSVIPAATSSNQVIIVDSDGSGDGDAVIKKTGVYFNFSVDRSEGTVQAARNLFDLAAIELIGRLLKVPYWHCLGLSENNEAVQQEVAEWMDMLDRDQKLIQFVRRVLFIKGFYDATESDKTRAFQQAVVAYQQSAGVQLDGIVDLEFMLALFGRQGSTVHPPFTSQLNAASQVGDTHQPTLPKTVDVSIRDAQDGFSIGEEKNLEVSLSKSGYLYCYFQDGQGAIQRFFPNRFRPDSYVPEGEVISLPGAMPFAIELDVDSSESITCFATDEEVFDRLPFAVRGADFELLATSTISSIKEAFIKTTLVPIGEASYGSRARTY